MKKKVTKITNEYTHDEKGFVVKHVETIEEYEVDVPTGGVVKDSNAISKAVKEAVEDAKKIKWNQANGVPHKNPFTDSICTVKADKGTMFSVSNDGSTTVTGANKAVINTDADTSGITHNITINTNRPLTELLNEVRSVLDKELKRSPF